MDFNIETIEKLEEGATYLVTFSSDLDMDECCIIAQNINRELKEHNRDIVFIYTRKDFFDKAEIKKE